MANEIQFVANAGITAYALIRDQDGDIWDGSNFVPYVTANLGTYAVYATEQGTASGYYSCNFPSVSADLYNITAHQRIGVTPAETDIIVASGTFYWDGTRQTNFIEHAGLIAGEVLDGSPTISSFSGDTSFSSVNDFYINSVLAFTEGALRGIARRITGYVGATRTFSFAYAFPVPPANDDSFVIIGRIE